MNHHDKIRRMCNDRYQQIVALALAELPEPSTLDQQRAAILFTFDNLSDELQMAFAIGMNPDAATVEQIEEYEAKVFEGIAQLLLEGMVKDGEAEKLPDGLYRVRRPQ